MQGPKPQPLAGDSAAAPPADAAGLSDGRPSANAAPGPVRFVDRDSGEVCEELIFGGEGLRWVYGGSRSGRIARALLRRRVTSRLYGLWQRSFFSRGTIPGFIEKLGIDAFEAERPPADYRSLDDFFTRRLKDGARPWAMDPGVLPSPCDARVFVYPEARDAAIPVKGGRHRLAEVLRDPGLARRYEGGDICVLRLAPADYHRFHFPDAGVPGACRWIGGGLDSVHPIALAGGARPFLENRRAVTEHVSENFGAMLLVDVGAALVGTIVQTYTPGRRAARGEEKGYFRFGGSTVILCTLPGAVAWDEDLVGNTGMDLETRVRAGSRIGVKR